MFGKQISYEGYSFMTVLNQFPDNCATEL